MRRIFTVVGLLVVAMGGIYLAFLTSRLVPSGRPATESYTYNLLFSSAWSMIPIAALMGVFFGAFNERHKEHISEGKVLRHDVAEFFEHWGHTLGMLFLLVSGVLLGFLFIPRFLHDAEAVGFAMNLHFVGVLITAFSVVYHITDLAVAGDAKELLPGAADFKHVVAHYAAKVGLDEPPKEGKYFASERLAYPVWIVSMAVMAITGLTKVAAHVWSLPAGLMAIATSVHDVFTLVFIAVLAAHIVLGAIVPWSWPHFVSMLTGYMKEETVAKYHVEWYEELTEKKGGTASGS
jgi:formate dehydrogenase subunit gamma